MTWQISIHLPCHLHDSLFGDSLSFEKQVFHIQIGTTASNVVSGSHYKVR